jgi:hypothetical protein
LNGKGFVMDIVCNGCRVKLRVPDNYLTGSRLKVRCKNCGSPIILLGAPPEVQALGASIVHQTQQRQPQYAPTPVPRSASSRVSPTAQFSRQPMVRESAAYQEPETKQHRVFAGARNESSVLFTLSNLKDLVKKREATLVEKTEAPGGYASGEGSGYIDIRALVSLSRQNAGAEAETETSAAERDDPTYPVQTNRPPTMFEGTASLAPVTLASETSNRALPIAIVAGAAMLAAGVVISFNVISQSNPDQLAAAGRSIARFVNTNLFDTGIDTESVEPSPPPNPVQENTVAEPVVATPEVEQPVVTPSQEADEDEDQMSPVRLPSKKTKPLKKAVAKKTARKGKAISAARAKPAPVKEKARVDDKKAKGYSIDDILAGDSKDKKAESETKPAEPPETDPLLDPIPAKKPTSRDRSVDELLDDAVADYGKPKAMPETPSRQEVMKAIKQITPAAKHCAVGSNETGVANLTIVVKGSSGQVVSAKAKGVEEPVRSCIEREAKKAQFPSFKKSELSINYPLKL